MARASEKCSITTFIEVDICQSNGTIERAVRRDLDISFQDQTFQVAILKRLENANITIAVR